MKLKGPARPHWVIAAIERGEDPYETPDTREVVDRISVMQHRLCDAPDTTRFVRLWLSLGCAHLEAGRSRKALPVLLRAMAADDADPLAAHSAVLTALFDLGDLGAAQATVTALSRGVSASDLARKLRDNVEAAAGAKLAFDQAGDDSDSDSDGGEGGEATGDGQGEASADGDGDGSGEGASGGDGDGDGDGEGGVADADGGGGASGEDVSAGAEVPVRRIPTAATPARAHARALIDLVTWAQLGEDGATETRAKRSLAVFFTMNPVAVACIAAAPSLMSRVDPDGVKDVADAASVAFEHAVGPDGGAEGARVWWWQHTAPRSLDAAVVFASQELAAWIDADASRWVARHLPSLINEYSDHTSPALEAFFAARSGARRDPLAASLSAGDAVAAFLEEWVGQRCALLRAWLTPDGEVETGDDMLPADASLVSDAVQGRILRSLTSALQDTYEELARRPAKPSAE